MADGRQFWIDAPVAYEIARRALAPVLAANTAEVERRREAEKEVAWLRRLVQWCRRRLRGKPYHINALDRYLAAGPTDATDKPPLAHSDDTR